MKKIVLVMIVALMGIAMNAQQPRHHKDHGSPEQMVERRVEKLAKVLELTEVQKAEVSKIYSQEMETMKQEHRSMSPEGQQQARPDESARKARHEQMKARRAETDAKIEALLTPEQATKFAEFKQHRGERGHRHDAGHKSPKRECKRRCCD